MLCVSISEKTLERVSEIIEDLRKRPKVMAEIRLEALVEHDLSILKRPSFFEEITKFFKAHAPLIPLIASCDELSSDDPDFSGYSQHRKLMLSAAISGGLAYAEVEEDAPPFYIQNMFKLARENHCRIVISTDCFPSGYDYYTNFIAKCQDFGEAIPKIITSVVVDTDLLAVYNYNRQIVAISPGYRNTICFWDPFVYVSYNEDSRTAPNQPTLEEMEKLLSII